MKLQFKEQQFQLDGVKAVVDSFLGQTQGTNRFTLEKSKDILRKTKQAAQGVATLDFDAEIMENIGYRNRPIQITDNQILKNIQKVQTF